MFWFMNHILNPLMIFVLRSRLHGWMSAGLLVLNVQGRKSGRAYTLVANYTQEGQTLTILPGMPEKKTWWRNLRGGAPVSLTLRGQARTGQAELLEGDAARERILEALRMQLRQSPSMAGMYGLKPGADGGYPEDGLRQAAAGAVVVRITLKPVS